jgi:hypothetical protein
MKRVVVLLAAGVVLGISAIASAVPVAYVANLNGASENPSNPSAGIGTTTVFIDTAAHTLRVVVSFSGLSAPTTASHIHCCIAPPGNAGVATATPTFPGFPLGVTSGNYDVTFDTLQASTWNATFVTANGGTPAGAEAALASGLAAGRAYLNVHTTAFLGGEIRGFLVTPSAPVGPSSGIPTLSELALAMLVVTLATLGIRAVGRRSA